MQIPVKVTIHSHETDRRFHFTSEGLAKLSLKWVTLQGSFKDSGLDILCKKD